MFQVVWLRQSRRVSRAARADQFDIIWHNDDWGQLWKKWLDTTDDVKGIENADKWPLLAFWNHDHKLTVVPMAYTVGTFFYRTDLVKPEEVPNAYEDLVHPRWAGRVGMEGSDVDWFGAMVKSMGEEKGIACAETLPDSWSLCRIKYSRASSAYPFLS